MREDDDLASFYKWLMMGMVGCVPLVLHGSNSLLLPKGKTPDWSQFYLEILFVALVNTGLIAVDFFLRVLQWNPLSKAHNRLCMSLYGINFLFGASSVYLYFKFTDDLWPPYRMWVATGLLLGSLILSNRFDDLLRQIEKLERLAP